MVRPTTLPKTTAGPHPITSHSIPSGSNVNYPAYPSTTSSSDTSAKPHKSSTPYKGPNPKGHPGGSTKTLKPSTSGTATTTTTTEPTNKNLFFFGTQ